MSRTVTGRRAGGKLALDEYQVSTARDAQDVAGIARGARSMVSLAAGEWGEGSRIGVMLARAEALTEELEALAERIAESIRKAVEADRARG